MIATRRKLSIAARNDRSNRITQQFSAWPIYQCSKTVMIYVSMPDEVGTDQLIEDALQNGKQVCVPILEEQYGDMSAILINNLNELTVGKFGLRMPNSDRSTKVFPYDIDLIVVPAVAFDKTGGRLGFGAGYYDRFLARAINAVFLGLAWDCQITGSIPCEAHDIKMDYLLTECGFYKCSIGES